jgi:hypothetical protein
MTLKVYLRGTRRVSLGNPLEQRFLVTNHGLDTARRYHYGNALDIIHG